MCNNTRHAAGEQSSNHDSAVSLAADCVSWRGYWMDDWEIGVWFRAGAEIPVFATASKSVLRPTQPLVLIGTAFLSRIYALRTCT